MEHDLVTQQKGKYSILHIHVDVEWLFWIRLD